MEQKEKHSGRQPKKSTSLYLAEDTKERLKAYGREKRIGSVSRVVEYIAWNDIQVNGDNAKDTGSEEGKEQEAVS